MSKMREIITIQVGQCGNQVGNKVCLFILLYFVTIYPLKSIVKLVSQIISSFLVHVQVFMLENAYKNSTL